MTRAGAVSRKVTAELIGTALLLAAIVGSGIMGQRLSGEQVAVALLVNTLATGAALVAIILAFGEVSGAHLNPAVTLAAAVEGGVPPAEIVPYLLGQIAGAVLGVVAAHAMFDEPWLAVGTHVRTGFGQWVGEFVATFGLLAVIWGCSRGRAAAVPFAVGAYITAAVWFTSSTSFANPAVTIARGLTDTFTGIRPGDIAPFIAAQLAGALAATVLFRWLVPALPARAADLVQPHGGETR